MKSLNYSSIINSFILGISIVTASLIFQHTSTDSRNEPVTATKTTISPTYDKPLLSLSETAEYLNISESKLKMIISHEETVLNQSGTFIGKMFPYFMVQNEIYVNKAGLLAWIEEASLQRKKY